MPHIHEKYDFTVSFFLIHRTTRTICLHYHKKLKFWNQLGGHIELNEHPAESIERELLEEAGLRKEQYAVYEPHKQPNFKDVMKLPMPFAMPLYKYGNLEHWHIDLPYIIDCKTQDVNPQEGESQDIKWFTQEEIKLKQSTKELGDTIFEFADWIFSEVM